MRNHDIRPRSDDEHRHIYLSETNASSSKSTETEKSEEYQVVESINEYIFEDSSPQLLGEDVDTTSDRPRRLKARTRVKFLEKTISGKTHYTMNIQFENIGAGRE